MAYIFRSLHGVRQQVKFGASRLFQSAAPRIHTSAYQSGVFEPDDLNPGPDIPEYEVLKVQMRGYDYVVLESYAKYIHNLVESLEIESDCWAVPPTTTKVQLFKPASTTIQSEYNLSMYERAVQLQDLPSTLLPVFLEAAQTNLPEGVTLTLKKLDLEEEEFRYIPDKELLGLQGQVEVLEKAREDRRKK